MARTVLPRPSGAGTWSQCSGNIDMRSMFPDAPDEADSDICEDGTACHWLAAEVWEGRNPPEESLSPNQRVITDEMWDAVDIYHFTLRSWQNVVPVCEKTIPINGIIRGMTGTPDAWAYNPTIKRLYIADLKFGFRFVEVWYNLQLICYACGLMELLGLDWNETTIEFVIVQPRSYHSGGAVRKWITKASTILPSIDMLRTAANAPTQYVPNPGCFDCPGRHVCVAYQNAGYAAVHVAYSGTPHELTPAALGKEMTVLKDAVKVLEGRISGMEAQADNLSRRGVNVPGWALKATFAREGWREGCDVAVMTLAEKYFNTTAAKPPKAISPAQARKVLPAGIVAMFAHKPSTGVRLTKVDPYAAHKAFQSEE